MAEATPKPTNSGLITAFRVLAIITTLAILIQFFMAGQGAFHDFQTNKHDGYAIHEKLGYVIAILGLVMAVVGALARLGGRAIGMAAVLFVLAAPVQALLAGLGKHHSEIGALHAFDGALILGLAFSLLSISLRGRNA